MHNRQRYSKVAYVVVFKNADERNLDHMYILKCENKKIVQVCRLEARGVPEQERFRAGVDDGGEGKRGLSLQQ
jgi:hypothetical protein